jgi:uncharacterized phage protein (TIGR01671 family)
MNRFKFRIWDKQQKKFHTDADWGISLRGSCIIGFSSHDRWDHDKGYKINLGNQDNLVVQQYTGLKDSKGVEIYEGDILKWHEGENNFSEVIFQNGSFMVRGINWGAFWYLSDYCDAYTCFGNVFENPELLEH